MLARGRTFESWGHTNYRYSLFPSKGRVPVSSADEWKSCVSCVKTGGRGRGTCWLAERSLLEAGKLPVMGPDSEHPEARARD